MPRVASLGMYDGAGARSANNLLWRRIAARLRARGVADVPDALDRTRPLDAIWSDPDLLLAQCCGYPLVTRYRDRLRVVATPRYTAEGCEGVLYRSRIIVRAGDHAASLGELRGGRAAINDRLSNSGMNLFRAAVAPLAAGRRFFANVVETGSHRASVAAVARGDADVAAIDTVSFAHLARDEPALAAQVRTIGWTDISPGLPFVTSAATAPDIVRALRETLLEIVRDEDARPAIATLLVAGIEDPPSYRSISDVEREAGRLGYAELA